MKRSFVRFFVILLALHAGIFAYAGAALADDGGALDDAGDAAPADAGSPSAADASSDTLPLACDGALCDTSNDATCAVARSGVGAMHEDGWRLVSVMTVGLIALAARRRRRGVAGAAFIAVGLAATNASAEPPPAVDVVIREPLPPQRRLAIEYSPLPLLVGKVSANVVFVPGDHHALVVSPFYAWATTEPIVLDNQIQLPQQKFKGFGAELGYRYYIDKQGPRGFFAGPSLILGAFTATAQNGSQTSYLDYGLALDVGYQALIGDRLALSLGGGLQYTATSTAIPNQQFPAQIYANDGLRPRVLFSIGWAF